MTEAHQSIQPAMPTASLNRVTAPVGEWCQYTTELTANCHLAASLDNLDKITYATKPQHQPNSKSQMPRMPAYTPPEEIIVTAGLPAAYPRVGLGVKSYLSPESSNGLSQLLIVAGPSRIRRRRLQLRQPPPAVNQTRCGERCQCTNLPVRPSAACPARIQ